jgi:hypothetical protein
MPNRLVGAAAAVAGVHGPRLRQQDSRLVSPEQRAAGFFCKGTVINTSGFMVQALVQTVWLSSLCCNY